MALLEKLTAVEKPEGGLREGLLKAYFKLAKEEGYVEEEGKGVALFLAKKDEKIAIEIQFGNRYEIVEAIKRLYSSGADLSILATSSLVRTQRFDELGKLLLGSFTLGEKRFAFIDIEKKRVLAINFEKAKSSAVKEAAPAQNREMQTAEKKADSQTQGQINQENRAHQSSNVGRAQQHGRRKMIYGRRGEHKEQD